MNDIFWNTLCLFVQVQAGTQSFQTATAHDAN